MTYKEAREYLIPITANCVLPQYAAALEKAMEALEKVKEPCELCRSKRIDITVQTKEPEDMYIFSTNEAIGLMYCPLCGRDLRRGDNG